MLAAPTSRMAAKISRNLRLIRFTGGTTRGAGGDRGPEADTGAESGVYQPLVGGFHEPPGRREPRRRRGGRNRSKFEVRL